MNKHVEIIEEESSTLSDRLLEFLVAKRKFIAYSSLALIVCATLLYRFVDGKKQGHDHAIIQAKLAEQALLKDDNKEFSLHLNTLSEILKENPDLAPSYTAITTQAYLLKGDSKRAEESLQDLERSSLTSPPMHFRSFSDASIMIAQGKLVNALDISESLSLSLDQKLSEETKASSPLYLMNSSRMAFLYQALQQQELEKHQWKKILALLDASKQMQNPLNQRIANSFKNSYSQGSVSLAHYAKSRLSLLN